MSHFPRRHTGPFFFWAAGLVLLILSGCAAPGPKYITLSYTGAAEDLVSGTIGIVRFSDKRPDTPRGQIGYRALNDGSRETFLVQGLDLAGTLTDQTQSFLEKHGIHVTPAPDFPEDVGQVAAYGPHPLLTADINGFNMSARKKAALTNMTLKVDITFFLADPPKKHLSTFPVTLTLERTEISFTREKVESFFNDTLAEVLEKALAQSIGQ